MVVKSGKSANAAQIDRPVPACLHEDVMREIVRRVGSKKDTYALATTSKAWMAAVLQEGASLPPEWRKACIQAKELKAAELAPGPQAKIWCEQIRKRPVYRELIEQNGVPSFPLFFLVLTVVGAPAMAATFSFIFKLKELEKNKENTSNTLGVHGGVLWGCVFLMKGLMKYLDEGLFPAMWRKIEKRKKRTLEKEAARSHLAQAERYRNAPQYLMIGKVLAEALEVRSIRQKVHGAIEAADCDLLKALAPALPTIHRIDDPTDAPSASQGAGGQNSSLFRLVFAQNYSREHWFRDKKSDVIGALLDAKCEMDGDELMILATMRQKWCGKKPRIKNFAKLCASLPAEAFLRLVTKKCYYELQDILAALPPEAAANEIHRIHPAMGASILYMAAAQLDTELLSILLRHGGDVDRPATLAGACVRDLTTLVGHRALRLDAPTFLHGPQLANFRLNVS